MGGGLADANSKQMRLLRCLPDRPPCVAASAATAASSALQVAVTTDVDLGAIYSGETPCPCLPAAAAAAGCT